MKSELKHLKQAYQRNKMAECCNGGRKNVNKQYLAYLLYISMISAKRTLSIDC